MSVLDIENLLKPVSDAAPCGEDLRYDRRYLEVFRLSEGKSEQQVGDKVIPAEEPNWREVRDGCLELFARSKDLRVSMLLALAALRMDGYLGLHDGLAVVKGLIDRYWGGLFPLLDPDDGNDPVERLNIIASLTVPPASYNDPMRFQDRVREAAIVENRQIGRVGLREILIASGELQAQALQNGAAALDGSAVEAVFEDTEAPVLEQVAKTIDDSAELVKGLEATLTERVGAAKSIDMSSFRTVLSDASKQVRKRLAKRGIGAGPAESGGTNGSGPAQRLVGDINSDDDVLLAIEKVCRYYETKQPSSPVPLMMVCARQLVGRKFQEIYKILSPEAVGLLEKVSTPEQPAS